MADNFTTKDSGQRINLANGMVRDTSEGKADYTLMLDGPLFERWSELLTRGAQKYGKRNWCKALAATDKAAREETKARFKESAFRHMMQWMKGDRSEDHAAAVLFNLNGYEAMRDGEQPITIRNCDVKIDRTLTPDRIMRESEADVAAAFDDELARDFGQSAYAPGSEPL